MPSSDTQFTASSQPKRRHYFRPNYKELWRRASVGLARECLSHGATWKQHAPAREALSEFGRTVAQRLQAAEVPVGGYHELPLHEHRALFEYMRAHMRVPAKRPVPEDYYPPACLRWAGVEVKVKGRQPV